MYKLNKNLIIFFQKKFFHIYNVDNRKNIFIGFEIQKYIAKFTKGFKLNSFSKYKKILFADCTHFSLWDNMYNNSNFFKHTKLKYISIQGLVDFLILNNFIVKRKTAVKNYTLDKFDGDLYQIINKHCLLSRKKINDWWYNQKFKKNGYLKKTPYKTIQENYLKKFFRRNLINRKVLEIGCGSGYYTKQMSHFASKIIGIDNDKELLKIAEKNKKKNSNFINIDLTDKGFSRKIKFKKFDYIFMIDFFLFLLNKKYQKNLYLNSLIILKSLKKLLAKKGKIIICDPHFFWLTPFFGDHKKPFGIINEYNLKKFSPISTLQDASNLFYNSGLVIEKVNELKPSLAQSNQLYNFYNQFPQWIVYELSKKK